MSVPEYKGAACLRENTHAREPRRRELQRMLSAVSEREEAPPPRTC